MENNMLEDITLQRSSSQLLTLRVYEGQQQYTHDSYNLESIIIIFRLKIECFIKQWLISKNA